MPVGNSEKSLSLEERFLAVLDQSPLSIQILSADGYTVQVNKAWEKLWGLTLDQIKNYNILEDNQLVKNGVMPYLERAFAGESVETPPVLYDPDETLPNLTRYTDSKRWTKAIIYPIKDDAGQVREVVLMHEDITERQLTEEALRQSEMRYRQLLENANDIIYSHDLQGKYLSINKAGEIITGYSREEVLNGMNMAEVVVPEHLEKARQMTIQKLKDPTPTVYEIDIYAKNGRRLTLEVSTRVAYENGNPVAVEGVARDVTERRRIESEKQQLAEQLEKQRKHLQAMVSNVPGVVWEAWGEPDADNQRIDFVSDYVETMLGYTIEEWLSTPNFWLSIVHPEDKALAMKTAAETFASGIKGSNQFRWLTKNGRAIWVEAQSIAIRDDSGKPIGMRGVTMDISERKRREFNEQFLAEASAALAISLDYETTLATIARLAVPHFADWCAVDIAGEDKILNRLAVAHSSPEKIAWAHEIHKRYPARQDATQGLYNVFNTGKSEFYPDISDEMLIRAAQDEDHLAIMRRIGFCSVMLVPIKAREQVLGVLTFVNSETSRRHTLEDLALAEDLANRAALAIENARLYRAEQQIRQAAERTSNLLRRLQSVSTSLSQALTPSEVTAAVVEQGINSLGAHAGMVVILNDAGTECKIVGTVNFPADVVEKWERFPLDKSIPIADAIRSRMPVVVEDFDDWKEHYPGLGLMASVTGSRSLVAFPLIVEGNIIGALGLSFPKPQKFTDDDYAFMLALAQQCAQALERARLYENEQQLRAQAEAANRLKDEFLATVSHELRTPLNAIVGWSSLLLTSSFDNDLTLRAIQTIERNAKTQAQIIEDLLDVSRIITGKLNLNLRLTELSPVIKTALETLQPSAAAKSIRVESDLTQENAAVWGDPDRLQQIMWNLLSNAIKFTPEGGKISVSLKAVGARAQIKISDTGQGISQEFLPLVFDRFSQADGSSTRKYGGLGLGLAIVRHLTELHGGSVGVESLGKDQGTTFIINLPLLREQMADVMPENDSLPEEINLSVASPQSDKLENLRVLIVEDETDTRLLLKTIIENCGARVITTESAQKAFQAIGEFKPDILVSDIAMPVEDGYSLIRRVRALSPEQGGNLPAIALTAYAREEDRAQALEAGFQAHLAKPIIPEDLISAVKEFAVTGNGNNSKS